MNHTCVRVNPNRHRLARSTRAGVCLLLNGHLHDGDYTAYLTIKRVCVCGTYTSDNRQYSRHTWLDVKENILSVATAEMKWSRRLSNDFGANINTVSHKP